VVGAATTAERAVSTSAKTCLVGNTGWVTDAAVASPELPEVEPVRFVAPDGAPVGRGTAGTPIADDRLVWLYETMVVTRELDEEFVNLQRQGQLALFPSCRGQEAAQVGCAAALRDSDWLFPQYRELGSFVVRGIEPEGIGLMWRGTWHGGLGFLERAVAPMSIPVGTHALHAVGAALASMLLGDDGVAVAFVGDGATSVGDVHEALNMAAVQQAPCLFYVQNNQWAISVPLEDQMRAPSIAHRAIGYGMPGVRVDGNDVLACLSVVAEAAQRARDGGGPTLIEAVTYDWDRTPRRTIRRATAAMPRWRRGRRWTPSPASAPIWSGRGSGTRRSPRRRRLGRRPCAVRCGTVCSTRRTQIRPSCSSTRSPPRRRGWSRSALSCLPSWSGADRGDDDHGRGDQRRPA
jgi:TPP-dependent pyruvate/acetoin dehydrogenase alpha subunit